MSTRCNIIVKDDHNSIQLYRHSDGYPDGRCGVISDLQQALQYSWELPRMEADDFAAAIIRAWKEGGGNIYIDSKEDIPKSLHGNIEYFYIIIPNEREKNWQIEVFNPKGESLWKGMLGEEYPINKEGGE